MILAPKHFTQKELRQTIKFAEKEIKEYQNFIKKVEKLLKKYEKN